MNTDFTNHDFKNHDSTNHDFKNSDRMNSDPHERARTMLALSGAEGLSNVEFSQTEQYWLAVHLASCPPCREFAANSRETIRSLRAFPVAASGHLVSKTQLRVRQRAGELQRQQERFWVVCVCCAAVSLCSVATTAVLWHGFAPMAHGQSVFSAPLFQLGYISLGLVPAIVVGIILLARGTYMADQDGSYQG